jgi:hypothetical protein
VLTALIIFHILTHLNLKTILLGICYYLHFAKEETETQDGAYNRHRDVLSRLSFKGCLHAFICQLLKVRVSFSSLA